MDRAAAIRRRVARLYGRNTSVDAGRFALGADAVDAALGGGLARARLHELFAADSGDAASAAGFGLLLALRAASADRTILWLRGLAEHKAGGGVHAPGLAGLHVDPARLLIGIAPDALSLLRCAADALRCAGLGALVIECRRNPSELDLTASRRLSLAAAASGVTAILVRTDAQPAPSAAETRWRVAAAPSTPLTADAPGMPAFDIELTRHRGGREGLTARLEWDGERGRFHTAPSPGAVVPVVRGGAVGVRGIALPG